VKEYDNNNRGVLFKNDKGDNDKRPDYRGSAGGLEHQRVDQGESENRRQVYVAAL